MTPDERRAAKRAYDHARYLRQREQRTTKARKRYHSDPQYRADKRAYRRGYHAGLRRAAKLQAQTFAEFDTPSTPAQVARLTDPTGNH